MISPPMIAITDPGTMEEVALASNLLAGVCSWIVLSVLVLAATL